ncbi:hypothetical protein JZ751_013825 [Albula glossodonta]|uniref:Uncharacterized protein n=1 Tax=Albula glossodonta TaxID=121402 RepID=A0A8T2NU23_9TELE|nr:hypothetical protein JZ751_013825 [Albula glossodonta]
MCAVLQVIHIQVRTSRGVISQPMACWGDVASVSFSLNLSDMPSQQSAGLQLSHGERVDPVISPRATPSEGPRDVSSTQEFLVVYSMNGTLRNRGALPVISLQPLWKNVAGRFRPRRGRGGDKPVEKMNAAQPQREFGLTTVEQSGAHRPGNIALRLASRGARSDFRFFIVFRLLTNLPVPRKEPSSPLSGTFQVRLPKTLNVEEDGRYNRFERPFLRDGKFLAGSAAGSQILERDPEPPFDRNGVWGGGRVRVRGPPAVRRQTRTKRDKSVLSENALLLCSAVIGRASSALQTAAVAACGVVPFPCAWKRRAQSVSGRARS